jgi:hypothetical protein
MEGFGQNFGNTGKAAMIPAALGTISGIQSIQAKQNAMALDEIKLEQQKKQEEFMKQPLSVDWVVTQMGHPEGSNASNFLKEQVNQVAENGLVTREKLKSLKEYLAGDEKMTAGFLGAQMKDVEGEYQELKLKREKLQEKLKTTEGSYQDKQQLDELKAQIDKVDMRKAALTDQLYKTQEVTKMTEKRALEERKQMMTTERATAVQEMKSATAERGQDIMKEVKNVLAEAMKEVARITGQSRVQAKGTRPSAAPKTIRYTTIDPVTAKKQVHVKMLQEGENFVTPPGATDVVVSSAPEKTAGKGGAPLIPQKPTGEAPSPTGQPAAAPKKPYDPNDLL